MGHTFNACRECLDGLSRPLPRNESQLTDEERAYFAEVDAKYQPNSKQRELPKGRERKEQVMAQMTGYVCDVCERFALKKENWIALTGGPNTQGSIDICSNKCLVKIARLRLESEKDLNGEVSPVRPRKLTSTSKAFNDDQKLAIVEEALENGVKATAEFHGLPWQAVARWKADLSK